MRMLRDQLRDGTDSLRETLLQVRRTDVLDDVCRQRLYSLLLLLLLLRHEVVEDRFPPACIARSASTKSQRLLQ
jgi:hypothetical protein